jgi:hypothetical protein
MAKLRPVAETLARSMFHVPLAEILCGQGFEKNLQQISIRPTFFNSFPQIVHNLLPGEVPAAPGFYTGANFPSFGQNATGVLKFRSHQCPEGDKSISPFVPGGPLQAGGKPDQELLIPVEVGGKVLYYKGGAFFFILVQQTEHPPVVEKPCLHVPDNMFLFLPEKPFFQDAPAYLAGDVIDDHFNSSFLKPAVGVMSGRHYSRDSRMDLSMFKHSRINRISTTIIAVQRYIPL